MAMSISKPFVLPLLMALLVLLVVSGSARRLELEADGSTGGEAAAVFGVGLPVIQFLKGL